MGNAYSFYSESYPPASTFSVDDIPDLSGQVIIVTGANTGIGEETVKALLQHKAKVYLAARSQDKAEQAIQDLKQQTGGKEAIFLKLDLADFKSVKSGAEEFLSKEKELHVLFNNAGVMMAPVPLITAQGYDLQFGTNVLGHFYFTKLLLPTLLATTKASPSGKARVINTSSFASRMGKLDFNTFKDGPARRKLSTITLYNQSKFGNVVFSSELARRYGDEGIVSVSLNPGNLKTDLGRHLPGPLRNIMAYLIHPAPLGALTQLWAGTTGEGLTMNGKYLIPWARYSTANPEALNEDLGKELWTWLEEQIQDV
ncbi:NAD(P)-binding protein [Coprinopsis marcescibilis]|uniref:NAD(P)-binding protein n=1 Tax=Coprinopsis marcescibilis TaxID=230819 RepID=A0A5C3KUU5_COPMA|nr:NAD(P)-binding protein [Coprinopsis marcescibilis]